MDYDIGNFFWEASGIAAGAPHNLLSAHGMGCAAELGALEHRKYILHIHHF